MNTHLPRATSRILLVEDEMVLMMMVEELLQATGYEVITAGRLKPALEAARSLELGAAVLDINLGGDSVIPVADELRQRGIPIVFASGYGSSTLPDHYRVYPMLQKPYFPADLLIAVDGALHS